MSQDKNRQVKQHEKHKRLKRRKIKHCQSVSIWGTAVKECSKSVGLSAIRQALAPCTYTQWMTWNLQEDTSHSEWPRACMSHCGSHYSGANIKHFTWYAPQMWFNLFISTSSAKVVSEKRKCRCWYFIILSAAHMLRRSILAYSPEENQGFKSTYTHSHPFSWKPTMRGSRCPCDWWFC